MIGLVFCITELEIGGAERALCELAVRIDRSRFDPVVFSLKSRPENESASCVPMLENAGIEIKFLDMSGYRSFPRGLELLTRELKQRKPRIFQSFLFHANILGRLAAARAKVPHVFSGIRVAEKDANCRLWLDRKTDRFVEKHVCVSRSVAEFSEKVARLPKEKLLVIPNGIDPEPFQNAKKADLSGIVNDARSKKAICIGRLHPQKGIDRLLKLWQKLERNDWELLIVGEGPERDRLLNQAKEIEKTSARNTIHFTGWRADVPELLSASDLLILPSRWEGMPNVLMQGMAAGLPVLSTRSEGVTELLGNLFEPQSWDFEADNEFHVKFRKLAENPEKRLEFGKKNFERISTEFSIEKTVDSYQDMYEKSKR